MNEKKTVLDVLKETICVLKDLRIPMSEMETIGFSIAKSINGIQACVDAMERVEAEEESKQTELTEENTQEETK